MNSTLNGKFLTGPILQRPVDSRVLLGKLCDDPATLTAGQAWRFRRNLVIYIAHKDGCSQRMLADVFDLPHSRIAAIVREMRARYGRTPCET